MATEADRKAAFLIMQLAEQGRFQEVLAQMIASYELSADVSFQDMAQLFSEVFGRIVELTDTQGQIWPGLLPGPIRSNNGSDGWGFEIIEEGQHADTKRLHRVMDILGSDTTDEKRLLCVFSYLVSEGLISDAGFVTGIPKESPNDKYGFMVTIIINPEVRHDETTDIIIAGETIGAESELNLANRIVEKIDHIDKIGRQPAEECAAWITHIESDSHFIMTWDQAKGIQALEEAENRLNSLHGWDESFQQISEDMAEAGREYASKR